MSLLLRTHGPLVNLHCSVALTEWDLDQELRLQTTTDQEDRTSDTLTLQRSFQRTSAHGKDEFIWYDKASDSFVQPNLWLMVNPNIVCPIHYETPAPPPTLTPTNPQTLDSSPHNALQEEAVCCLPKTSFGKPVKSRRKPRTNYKRSDSRWRHSCSSWPRPPVNYCVLIGLALKCNGSLRVQQIYNFTRELFPFFQSAPDGWKNTIRHNLCFNNSFRKAAINLHHINSCTGGRKMSSCAGKRTSCVWHLTPDGHHRLQEDLQTLSKETMTELKQSAAKPDLIRKLLSL